MWPRRTILTPDRLTLIAEFGNALAEVREVDAVWRHAPRSAGWLTCRCWSWTPRGTA